jgi:hypothetical protein
MTHIQVHFYTSIYSNINSTGDRRPVCGKPFAFDTQERIIGGEEVTPHSIPYQVGLVSVDLRRCLCHQLTDDCFKKTRQAMLQLKLV